MIKPLYPTRFTREQMAGKKSPQRDMTNRKSLERSNRKAAWSKRQNAAKGKS